MEILFDNTVIKIYFIKVSVNDMLTKLSILAVGKQKQNQYQHGALFQ